MEHAQKEIHELGDQFSLKLHEGWIKYLTAAGERQSFCQRPNTSPAKKIIVEEDEKLLQGTWNAALRLGRPFWNEILLTGLQLAHGQNTHNNQNNHDNHK